MKLYIILFSVQLFLMLCAAPFGTWTGGMKDPLGKQMLTAFIGLVVIVGILALCALWGVIE